jgi:hypothetical protein
MEKGNRLTVQLLATTRAITVPDFLTRNWIKTVCGTTKSTANRHFILTVLNVILIIPWI